MYVVDMCYKILDSCSRVRVSLTCMFSISSMMLGRLELMWHVFRVIMWVCIVEVLVGYICIGICVGNVMYKFGVNHVMG